MALPGAEYLTALSSNMPTSSVTASGVPLRRSPGSISVPRLSPAASAGSVNCAAAASVSAERSSSVFSGFARLVEFGER